MKQELVTNNWNDVPVKVKVKVDIALHGNPISELRDVTCHMGLHSVTCHPTQVNASRLTPAMQAGTRFTYPGGREGWVDLAHLVVPRPGVEPATFRSRVRRRAAAPPRQATLHTVGVKPAVQLFIVNLCWSLILCQVDCSKCSDFYNNLGLCDYTMTLNAVFLFSCMRLSVYVTAWCCLDHQALERLASFTC